MLYGIYCWTFIFVFPLPGPVSFISAFGKEPACTAVIGFLYRCCDKRFGLFSDIAVYPLIFKVAGKRFHKA